MKKFLKKSLSLVLAITIILSSVYAGLNDVDFSIFFAVKTRAANTSVLTFKLNPDGSSYSVDRCDMDVIGDVVIPDTYNGLPVTGLSSGAFGGCRYIYSITIPTSVVNIDSGSVFYACYSLRSIIVDEDNPNYSSLHGVLFNKNKTVLIRYPLGFRDYGAYVIPDTVKIIDYMAFFDSSLEAVIIPDSVIHIGEMAFTNCSLASVTIPNSITHIGYDAFYGCTALTDVYYNDSQKVWNKITIDNGNDNLINATIHYSEHTHAYGDWIIDSAPTCTDDGVRKKICLRCDDVVNETIASPGHVYSDEWTIDIQPTQTTAGSKSRHCLYCDAKTDVTVIAVIEYLTYELSSDGTYYSVISCDTSACGDIVIPDTYNGLPVTHIKSYAFDNCSIDSLSIPLSIRDISSLALMKCNLKEIIVDENNPNYSSDDGVLFNKNKTKLLRCPTARSGEYIIPDTVTGIDIFSFYGCTSLVSINIPDVVTYIGDWAFCNCTSLTSITIPNSVTSIGVSVFEGCTNLSAIAISEGIIKIGGFAFYGCTSLASVTIPDSVTSIGGYAFGNCINLVSVKISENLSVIDAGTFAGCTSLASVTIPDSVTNIGGFSFRDCTSLKSIIIPAGVTNIGDYAFRDCSNLTSITIFNGVTSIGEEAFKNCGSLTSITIPDSVTSIGDSAFNGCTNLTSITIPDGVTIIGERTFRNCKNLTSLTIPESVTTIGAQAFYGCTSFTSITIPDSVTSIGESVFPYKYKGVIYCAKDSAAHNYAIANNIACVLVNIFETASSQIDYENCIIKTAVQCCDDITRVLGVSDFSRIVVTASCKEDSTELLGTGTIISVYEGETHIDNYTLVVGGDTNGDSVCDALDCFEVERAANGNTELSDVYAMAADSNSDDVVDITDYQAIVNKALAS